MKSYLRYEPEDSFGVISSPQSNVVFDFSGHLAITAAVRNVSIWNIRQAANITTLKTEHPNYPYQLSGEVCVLSRCLDKQKSSIAVGYSNGLINVYNYISKSLTASFQGHTSAISCLLDFHSSSSSTHTNDTNSGYFLASGGCDCDITIWDLISSQAICKLRGHKDTVTDMVYLNLMSRRLLISVSKDTLMKVWCLDTQQCIQTIIGHRFEIWSVTSIGSLHGTGTCAIITGSADNEIRGYLLNKDIASSLTPPTTQSLSDDVAEEKILTYIGSMTSKLGTDKCVQLIKNPDENMVAAQSTGKVIEFFNIREENDIKKKVKRRLKRQREKNTKQSLNVTDSDAADSDNDNVDSDNEEENKDENDPDSTTSKATSIVLSDILEPWSVLRCAYPVRGFDFSPLRTHAHNLVNAQEPDIGLVSLVHNILEVYKIPSAKSVLSREQDHQPQKTSLIDLHGHRSDVRAVTLSADGRTIATCSSDGLRLWSVHTQTCIRSCDSGYGLNVLFAPGNRYVILSTKEGCIQLIDTASGNIVMNENAHEGLPVYGLAMRPDGKGFVSGAGDKYVKFWDFQFTGSNLSATLSRQLVMSHDILSITYSCTKSADKLLVAIGLLDGTTKLLYDDTLKFFLSLYGHKLPVLCMDISNDNTLLVSGSADKTVKIWGLDFGDCHRSLFAHEDSVTAVKFQPHTHYFFSCGKDGRIKYWDADRFECILLLSGHKGSVWNICLSTEGTTLISCGQDRTIRVWKRGEDFVFVEEEKEKELEAQVNITAEREARADFINNTTVNGITNIVSTLSTTASVKSGECLIQVIDTVEADLSVPYDTLHQSNSISFILSDRLCRPYTNLKRKDQSAVQMASIYLIPDEGLTHVLEFLRATDLCSCLETCKTIFSKERVRKAIKYQLNSIYVTSLFLSSVSKPYTENDYRCDFLYIREVKTMLAALSYSPGSMYKGYWVSASWLSNAKKYYDALILPSLDIKKKNGKKQAKIRQRRGSDALPPWPSINADITCVHGGLCLSKNVKSRRKLVDKRVWFFLRKFYGKGPEFHSSTTDECIICQENDRIEKSNTILKQDLTMSQRKAGCEFLEDLIIRKTGVPHIRKYRRSDSTSSESVSSSDIPHIYHMIDSIPNTPMTDSYLNPTTTTTSFYLSEDNSSSYNLTNELIHDTHMSNVYPDLGFGNFHESSDIHVPISPQNTDSMYNPSMTMSIIPTTVNRTLQFSTNIIDNQQPQQQQQPLKRSSSTEDEDRLLAEQLQHIMYQEDYQYDSYVTNSHYNSYSPNHSSIYMSGGGGVIGVSTTSSSSSIHRHDNSHRSRSRAASSLSHDMGYDAWLSSAVTPSTRTPTRTLIPMSNLSSTIQSIQSQPLLPGMYHIIPRTWLKKWRKYMKDPSTPRCVPLDCTLLLCHAHGEVIIPPHVEEYLSGIRRSLLAGLGDYKGEIVEIVTSEEYDMMHNAYPDLLSDFNIRFTLDGELVTWSQPICRSCDPFNYRRVMNKGKPLNIHQYG